MLDLTVFALNRFDQIGPMRPTELTAIEVDMGGGSYQVTVPVHGPRSVPATLAEVDYPGIEIVNNRTKKILFAGFQTGQSTTTNGDGTTITFTGKPFQSLLDDLVLYPDTSNVSNAQYSRTYNNARASTMALAEILSNGGAGALAGRGYYGLTIGSDPVAGPVLSATIKNQPMLEAFGDWFAGSSYTFRLRLVRGTQGLARNVHFEVFQRPTSQVLLSPEAGNVREITVEERAGSPTHYIGIGEPIDSNSPLDDPPRHVIEAGTTEVDWRTRRVETIFSRPSADDDVLFSEADQERIRTQAQTIVRLRGVETDKYGLSEALGGMDLGWYVPVRLGSGNNAQRVVLPVTQSTIRSIEPGRYEHLLDIGGVSENGIGRMFNAIGAISRRVGRIEGNQ